LHPPARRARAADQLDRPRAIAEVDAALRRARFPASISMRIAPARREALRVELVFGM
jgi:hypothetical protein